jgi:hypothetical protein
MDRRLIAFPLLLATIVLGQRFRSQEQEEEGPRPVFPSQAEVHFVRAEYTDLPEYHRFFGFASRGARAEGWWVVDWPDADDHFSQGVERLTRIATGDPRHMRFTDDRLFDLYATQTGWWNLSEVETARLREYLLRGGFLVVDDFWGAEQWETFRQTMARVLAHGGGGKLQHRCRRCLGVCGFADLSGGDDGARVSVWDQLPDLFDDALSVQKCGRWFELAQIAGSGAC